MQKEKTKVIYSKEQYQADEKNLQESLEGKKPINWSSFSRLMINDLCRDDIIETHRVGIYSLEQIQKALEYPHKNCQVLTETSDYLMRISPHYAQLNRYYSNMGTFDWNIEPFDVKTDKLTTSKLIDSFKSSYFDVCSQFEKINVKHEMSKIMKYLPYQDVYYGLICEVGDDFFFQRIDNHICKLSKIQDGIYNFKINLSGISALNINAYPEYLQRAYLDFTNGKSTNMWYTPPSDKQICLKFQEHLTYPLPLLVNIVSDIFDLDTYKKLKLQSARTDNFKAILIKVPIDESTIDKPLLTPETLGVFAEINKESMSDDIGLIHTLGSDGSAISFKDSSNSRNNVADATDDIYNASGESKELFNGSSSGTALTFSIENDSALIYGLYRQIERYFNRYIKLKKFNKTNYKFAFKLHNSTVFNHTKVSDEYLKASQNGLPCKMDYVTSLGKTPSKVLGSLFLENDVLKFHEVLIPLSTSYTQSGDTSSGCPTNESQNKPLDESGEQTQKNDSNTKR